MDKLILKIVAIIALLTQVFVPMWWGAVMASFYYFWIEGVFESGTLNIFGSYEGNIFWGLFSVYCIIAAIVAIRVSFSIKMSGSKLEYSKKDIIFLLINTLTIILAISLVVWNGGIIPKM